jgi:hypothetical protein
LAQRTVARSPARCRRASEAPAKEQWMWLVEKAMTAMEMATTTGNRRRSGQVP